MRIFTDDMYRLWNSVLDIDNNLTEFRKNVIYVIADYMMDKGISESAMLTRNGFANAIYTCLDAECSNSIYSDLFVGLTSGFESLTRRRAGQPVHVEAMHEDENKPYVKFSIEFTEKPFLFDKPPHAKQNVIDGRKVFISNMVLGTNEPNDIEKVIVEYIYKNIWDINVIEGGKCDIPTLTDIWKKYLESAANGDVVDPTVLLFLSNMESVDLVTSMMFDKLYAFLGKTGYKHQLAGRIVYDLNKVRVIPETEETYFYSFIKGKE